MRKKQLQTRSAKVLVTILSFASAGIMLFLVPPTTIWVISIYIVLLSFAIGMLTSFFTDRKNSILVGLFVGLLLSTNYLSGFNFINTILLGSFIIGIRLLIT